jgi:hypothetical protein
MLRRVNTPPFFQNRGLFRFVVLKIPSFTSAGGTPLPPENECGTRKTLIGL